MAFQFPLDPIATSSISNPATGQRYNWDGTKWTTVPIQVSSVVSSSYTFLSQNTDNFGVRESVCVGRLVGSQTVIGGSDLVFDAIMSGTGSIRDTYSTATGIFTLKSGKTYELFCSPTFENVQMRAGGFIPQIYGNWVNATTNVELYTGSAAGNGSRYYSTDLSSIWSCAPYCSIFYTVTGSTDMQVKFRLIPGTDLTNSTASFSTSGSTAWIYQII